LNTRIATTLSLSPRAAGAWRALMRELRLSGTPAARVLNPLLEARAASHTVSHVHTACSWLERSHSRNCSRPFLCRCIGDCSRLQRGGLSCDWLCAHKGSLSHRVGGSQRVRAHLCARYPRKCLPQVTDDGSPLLSPLLSPPSESSWRSYRNLNLTTRISAPVQIRPRMVS